MLNLFLSGEGGFQTNKKENRSKKLKFYNTVSGLLFLEKGGGVWISGVFDYKCYMRFPGYKYLK